MKILVFSHEFPPMSGGAGTYAFELANGLAFLNHDVTLLIGENHKTEKDLKNINASIKAIYYPWQNKFWFLHWHKHLEKICLNDKFDLLILANFTAIISASKLAQNKLPKKVLLTIHGGDIDYFFGDTRKLKHHLMFSRKKIIKLFHNADHVIAVSDYLKKCYLRYNITHEKNCTFVYHGIDYEKFSAFDSIVSDNNDKYLSIISNNNKIILCVSRLAKNKGHDVLISAMKLIAVSNPNAKMVFIGDGPEKERIIDKIVKNNLTEKIIMMGAVDRKLVNYYYSKCDVFAMISNETFGIVYVEAMVFKKPIVAASCGAVPEIVKNDYNGYLVEPTDSEAVADRIKFLLDNESKRVKLGENGYELVRTVFNNVSMAEKTLGLINK